MEMLVDLMREYVRQLNEAADAYYNGQGEKMSDFEWDALFDKVKALEKETGVILPDSPTNKVSADTTPGQKEAHEFAALSLAKTKQVNDLIKWADDKDVWVSWKLDGLTLVVTYDGGTLQKVVTRGDGHIGTNITHLAPAIKGILPKIDFKGHLVLRGECLISYADFESFTATSTEDYANPRNLASGSLTLKDLAEVKSRHLQWIVFSLVDLVGGDPRAPRLGDQFTFLEALGFQCVTHRAARGEQIRDVVADFTTLVESGHCPFPVDGLVVAYDDTEYAKTGSVTGHHATRAGLAFKWADEAAETYLKEIEWSCAVGSITPVAIFEPVELEGTTVKRASLCNLSELERLGIGGSGTLLSVIKANKIIPKVVKVVKKEGELTVPDHCPVCGAPTLVEISEAGIKKLTCTNEHCAARELRKFMRLVGKEGLDIDGLAGETIQKFINQGWIKCPADIYRLGQHHDEIAALEGFGEKSADNIAAAIEKARVRKPEQLIVALNIPGVGVEKAKKLLDQYKTAQAVLESFNIDAHDLLAELTLSEYVSKSKTGTCAGMTFVITGEVHHYANRAELKEFIESQGGKVTGSVSKSTTFLINNDVTSTSGKNKKAQELNIPILSEDDFIHKFTP